MCQVTSEGATSATYMIHKSALTWMGWARQVAPIFEFVGNVINSTAKMASQEAKDSDVCWIGYWTIFITDQQVAIAISAKNNYHLFTTTSYIQRTFTNYLRYF